jgi:hypothetical protein
MHKNYQLIYYPLMHIISLAFINNVFENLRFIFKLFHKFKMFKRLHILFLRFKKNILNIFIF